MKSARDLLSSTDRWKHVRLSADRGPRPDFNNRPSQRIANPTDFDYWLRPRVCQNASGSHLRFRRTLATLWPAADRVNEQSCERRADCRIAGGAMHEELVAIAHHFPAARCSWIWKPAALPARRCSWSELFRQAREFWCRSIVRQELCRGTGRAGKSLANRRPAIACSSRSTAKASTGQWFTTEARDTIWAVTAGQFRVGRQGRADRAQDGTGGPPGRS